ncbi:TPA: hypothetical protein VVG47_001831, partial [Streptococcus pneumoniae]|nr:hypothetical protein [Streptococcus pneumoniae]HEU3314960.1 hypothetical protein [Streptococcus pneumoniae]
MNKKKMILTSLASVAILGAGFVASSPTVVRAEDAPVANQSKAEKDYDAAVKKSEAAKKAYEEAKKKAEDAQKKYDEDQKKTEAKADKEAKASAEIDKATFAVQSAYVKFLNVQSNRQISENERKKQLAEIDKEIENAKQNLQNKQEEFNKVRAEVIPEAKGLAVTKQKAEEAKKEAEVAKRKYDYATLKVALAKKEVEAKELEIEKLQYEISTLEQEVATAQHQVDNLKKLLAGADPDDGTEVIEAKLNKGEAEL